MDPLHKLGDHVFSFDLQALNIQDISDSNFHTFCPVPISAAAAARSEQARVKHGHFVSSWQIALIKPNDIRRSILRICEVLTPNWGNTADSFSSSNIVRCVCRCTSIWGAPPRPKPKSSTPGILTPRKPLLACTII